MAAPYPDGNSTGSTDATGGWTHTCHAPAAAGQILIVQVVQDGTNAGVPDITSITNAENLAGTDNVLTKIGQFDIGSPAAARQHLWIGRTLSTSAPVVTGSNSGGDDVYIKAYTFASVNTGTTLAEVIENGTAGGTANGVGTGTTISDTSVTTLGPDRLALNFVGVNDDVLTGVVFDGETGGDWKYHGSVYAEASGTDASCAMAYSWLGLAAHTTNGQSSGSIHGETGTNERSAQSFASGAGGSFDSIILDMIKSGTPTDDIVVEIQTDSGGVPSGTVVGTAGQINGSLIGTVRGRPTTFDAAATLSASTTYYIVMRRTGARDTTNKYESSGTNVGTYTGGVGFIRNSGTWGSGTGDNAFALQSSSGNTIDGGTTTIASAGWGVVGFALIGTTAAAPAAALPLGATRGAGRDRYGLMSRARALMPWWIREPRMEQALPAMMAPLGE